MFFSWRRLLRYSLALPLSIVLLIAAMGRSRIEDRAPMLLRSLQLSSIYLSLPTLVHRPPESALQIEVLRSSDPPILARSGAQVSIQANFDARASLPKDDTLLLFLVDAHGGVVARAENDLNNRLTILPTSRWIGPITVLSSMTIPKLPDGIYSIMVSLYGPSGSIQLSHGPGVAEDASLRYSIGTLRVDASAPPPDLLPMRTLDLAGFHLTFDEQFKDLSISDSRINDGARWYAKNQECCMATTDGTDTAMVGFSSPRNPFSHLAGDGLNIRLQRVANSWTSGVLTSVDSLGNGFSQQYGYFEMKAQFPPGENTWPAFWLLNTASKSRHAAIGEIDIVEYIANPGFPNYIATTLHDWSNNTAPAASHYQVPLPTAGFHTYGMMWTASTMTFYFDGAVMFRTPTPANMKQPYYLLVDLGIGSGYHTENTPVSNDMQIEYIRAYSKADLIP